MSDRLPVYVYAHKCVWYLFQFLLVFHKPDEMFWSQQIGCSWCSFSPRVDQWTHSKRIHRMVDQRLLCYSWRWWWWGSDTCVFPFFWQSVLLTVWLTNPRGPETADPMNIWDTTYAEQHIVYFSWCLRPTSLLDCIYAHIWPHTISWHPDYKFCVVLQLRKLLISRNITLLSVLEPTSLTPSINCEPFFSNCTFSALQNWVTFCTLMGNISFNFKDYPHCIHVLRFPWSLYNVRHWKPKWTSKQIKGCKWKVM